MTRRATAPRLASALSDHDEGGDERAFVCCWSARLAAVLVVVGTARLSASGAPNARAATTVTKFDANGAAAFVSFATITCEGFVSVARGGSSKAPETFVAYVVIDRLTGLPIEEGQGVIPNEAFAASKTSAQLTVDTSTVPNFIFSTGERDTDQRHLVDYRQLRHREHRHDRAPHTDVTPHRQREQCGTGCVGQRHRW